MGKGITMTAGPSWRVKGKKVYALIKKQTNKQNDRVGEVVNKSVFGDEDTSTKNHAML